MEKIIFHIDVNSAFLSWTAVWRLKHLGHTTDLREIPSVIAGNRDSRHSIILAKSIPAKKYGIQTGEPLGMALDKCPGLVIAEPDYALYVSASRRLLSLLRSVSPEVEQYSIDEAWVDMTGTEKLYGPPVLAAEQLKARIHRELGFTVNIGISSNKLLAKVAGDFEKPDKVHTLFPDEIETKLWRLDVGELFMVGRATVRKLSEMGIVTVGQLAKTDPAFLRQKLGKQGQVLWQYANGQGMPQVQSQPPLNKGYGNAFTTPCNVTDARAAHEVLLSLCETVGMRLRKDGQAGACLTVQLRSSEFVDRSKQRRLPTATNVTQELYEQACSIFDQTWDGKTPLRLLGVQVTGLEASGFRQYSLFDLHKYERLEKLDSAVDAIREKFGEGAIIRAAFVDGSMDSMAGGLSKHRRSGITKPVGDPAEENRKKEKENL